MTDFATKTKRNEKLYELAVEYQGFKNIMS